MAAINTTSLLIIVFGTIKMRIIHAIKILGVLLSDTLAGGHVLGEFVHALTAWSTLYGESRVLP